ncbi:hypothetical protein [Paraburkholderia sp. J76]|uniref:hypothetical protein n=1 Tax=Paraburkholderia sp. J76 TaxID=2805439 RepID=UPI002ABD35AE|nr:hypothetical protein [Paraburkholderia sp. J76]
MSVFSRRQFALYTFAASLQAACAAWPCAVLAQNAPYGAATGGSSLGGTSVTAGSRSNTAASPAQRQQLDEQRLLGGPSTSSGSPYSMTPYKSNGASPDDAQDALTNEKHMHVVTPGDYAASAARASGGRSDRSGGAGSRIGSNGRSRAGNAVARGSAGTPAGGRRSSAGYDYGASQTSPTAQVYGNPYGSPYGSPDQSNSDLYKSPW